MPDISVDLDNDIDNDIDNGAEVPCQACGHQPVFHGPTGTRFCRATLDRALDRRCLCNAPDAPPPAPMYEQGKFSGR